MISIVYLCTSAPNGIADELIAAGYRVFEALAVSEVFYLCEHHTIAAVVIAADVEDPNVIEAQVRHVTVRLKPHATAKDLIWELENLLGRKFSILQ
jgi:hypothetical protein